MEVDEGADGAAFAAEETCSRDSRATGSDSEGERLQQSGGPGCSPAHVSGAQTLPLPAWEDQPVLAKSRLPFSWRGPRSLPAHR